MPLSPNYNPKQYENNIYKTWQDNKIGTPELQNNLASKPSQSIDSHLISGNSSSPKTHSKTHTILMPPPNLTGNLHAGHAFGHYVQDTLSRLARQRGEADLWFPGVDHAGLQLEGVIDKLIKKGEFDEIIRKAPNLVTGKTAGDGIFYFSQDDNLSGDLVEVTKEDLPKYLKVNCPDLWLECAWSKVNLWRNNQKEQSAVLGDTPDYERSLFTLDDKNIDMVNYAFQKYWQDGLIYKGSYLVNWSVGLNTALSDVAGEIEYEKRTDPFVTFEYRMFSKNNSFTQPLPDVEGQNNNNPSQQVGSLLISDNSSYKPLHKAILVSTVRPETVFGDYAVAVHPEVFVREYSEFQDLLQKNELFVQIPLTERFIPVILADEVDPNFGSGALKITPAHDIVDYEIFNKYIGGDFEQAIGRDGKLTALCGKYAGLTVTEGRKSTIQDMLEQGFVPKKLINGNEQKESKSYFDITFNDDINPEDYQIDWNYEHNVTVCERTKTVVEPLISEEFFVGWNTEFSWAPTSKDDNISISNKNQAGQKTTLAKLGKTAVNKTNFYSSEYKERGINFLNNIKDWCISRDLIWGHKMPVWYNLETNFERKFWSFEEMKKLNSPLDRMPQSGAGVFANQYFAISTTKPTTQGNWVQEEKILDTWFSSCLWPLSTLDYAKFVKSKTLTKSNLIHIHGGEVWQDKSTYRSKIQSGELNSYWYSKSFDNAVDGFKTSWKSEVSNFCKDNYISLIKPQMPNKTNADYTKWKWVFEQSLPFITDQTVLVGHSLGSMFLTRYLSENKLDCKAVFLVSGGLWTNSENKREDFDVNWGLDSGFEVSNGLIQLGNKINIVHSKDDYAVEFARSVNLKAKLPNANFLELDGLGHLSGECEQLANLIIDNLKIETKPTDFEVFYPSQEMVTGKDIFYQWIVRMTTLGYYFTAEIPYTDLVITPTVLDDKGKKMSKSLNNGMDPVAQIDKYSSDALRMALLGGMIPDRNIKMGGRIADELCEKYRNFGNKLWNVARFFEYQEERMKQGENEK